MATSNYAMSNRESRLLQSTARLSVHPRLRHPAADSLITTTSSERALVVMQIPAALAKRNRVENQQRGQSQTERLLRSKRINSNAW